MRRQTADKGIKLSGYRLNGKPENLALHPSSPALIQCCNKEMGELTVCLLRPDITMSATTNVTSISYGYMKLYSSQKLHVCV